MSSTKSRQQRLQHCRGTASGLALKPNSSSAHAVCLWSNPKAQLHSLAPHSVPQQRRDQTPSCVLDGHSAACLCSRTGGCTARGMHTRHAALCSGLVFRTVPHHRIKKSQEYFLKGMSLVLHHRLVHQMDIKVGEKGQKEAEEDQVR